MWALKPSSPLPTFVPTCVPPRLQLLDPKLVLQRGYALITRPDGTVLARAAQARAGEAAQALLADGRLDVTIDRTTLD